MSDETVLRYDMVQITRCGESWQELQPDENGDWMEYADHKAIVDALRTQARELAKAIIAHIGLEPELFLTVSQCPTASECVRLNDRIQTANIIRDKAQVVLKERR